MSLARTMYLVIPASQALFLFCFSPCPLTVASGQSSADIAPPCFFSTCSIATSSQLPLDIQRYASQISRVALITANEQDRMSLSALVLDNSPTGAALYRRGPKDTITLGVSKLGCGAEPLAVECQIREGENAMYDVVRWDLSACCCAATILWGQGVWVYRNVSRRTRILDA
jgi:hypothetical protein